MSIRTTLLVAVSSLVLVSAGRAEDSALSSKEVAVIEAHASSWDLVLKREHLKAMTVHWLTLTADPDSATTYFGRMLPVADAIVDRLAMTTGYSREHLMRWLESDIGLNPYFFPPRPEQLVPEEGGGLWWVLKPLLPILLYRLVDRALDE
jgi:hypothetical protein